MTVCRVYSNVDNIQDIFFQCFCFSFNMFNKIYYISMCAHDQWTSYFPHSMLKSFFPFFTQFLFHYKNFGWKNHPFLRIGKCLLETVVGKIHGMQHNVVQHPSNTHSKVFKSFETNDSVCVWKNLSHLPML